MNRRGRCRSASGFESASGVDLFAHASGPRRCRAAATDLDTVCYRHVRMFVLGIDPGLTRCGYGAVRQGQHARPRAVAAGVITTSPDSDRAERLAELQAEIRGLVDELRPDVVAVERLLFQKNAATAMAVGQAAGVVMAEAAAANCPVVEYSPNEVKQSVAGYGGAGKPEVSAMVQRLLDLPHRLRPADAADALAVALCHLARLPPVPAPGADGAGAGAVSGETTVL